MAHSSPQRLPEFPGFPQSKTLFITAAVKIGVLLTPRGVGYRKRQMRFADPHAALSWCEAHGASLVFLNAPDHSGN